MSMEVGRGTVLGGRYRLAEALATDPLVHVWQAEDAELRRPVMCKVLHPQWMDDQDMIDRFRFGAFAATRLDHENVARTYDVQHSDDAIYTVSEYVDGPDVGKLIEAGTLPVEAVAAVGLQAAAGLSAAHERGLVHGGVCPENLVIGSSGRLCLIDFGSVQFEHTPDAQRDEPQQLEPGIRDYWAPERLDGGDVETETDIYSLGLVLWEALTGEPAVEVVAPASGARRLLKGLTGGDDDPASRLRQVLMAATADEPADRPTAPELAEQLVALAGVRPEATLESLLAQRSEVG